MAQNWRGGKSKQTWKAAPPSGPAPGTPAAKRRQLFIVLFLFLALVGVVAAWFVLLKPPLEPYFMPLCITEYKDRHIPPNAQADQDREALLAGNYFPQRAANAFASQERRLLIQELDGLRSRKPKEATIVYLSAHVVCDPAGELFLLPGDASIDDPATWFSFHDLLDRLRACPSEQKLLVLDVSRPLADPRLGVLANDIAARIPEALDKVEDPHRLVLCSCSPGQVSLTSEDAGQSVFGYYFELALRGWADGYNPENRADARVSAREAALFVRLHVDRWAARNRKVQQTPVLYGPANADFELVTPPHGDVAPANELAEAATYPDWLLNGWRLRDRWWDDQTHRLAPQAFRRLEASLLRAELLWRGGARDQVQRDLAKETADLEAQAKAARDAQPKLEPHSLARVYPTAPKALIPLREELKKLLNQLGPPPPGAKPDEVAAALAKSRKDFLAKFEKKPAADLAWVVFDTAAQENTAVAERIHFLADLIQEAQPRAQFAETLFLQRLNGLYAATRGVGSRPWPEKAVRLALQATQKGERALAAPPQALPWVRPLLESATQKRHDGEALLFSLGFAPSESASRLLEEAVDEVQGVTVNIETVQDAYRTRDEAVAQFLGIAPYLMNRPDPDIRTSRLWNDAMQVWKDLDTLLADPRTGKPVAPAEVRKEIEQLQQKSDALRTLARSLVKPFTTPEVQTLVQKVTKVDTPLPEFYGEIDGLLQATCLRAADRQELWAAGRKLARRLQEDTARLDQEDREKHRRPSEPSVDKENAAKREQERSVRRTQVAIDLLKLGGLAVPEAESGLAQASRPPVKPDAWPAEGARLREAWAKQLPTQLAELRNANNLPALDRLGRIFYPFDVSPALADPGPAADLEKRRAVAGWTWLADRYRYDSTEARALARKSAQPNVASGFFDDLVSEIAREVPEASRAQPASSPFTELTDAPDLSSGRSGTCRLRLEVPGVTRREGNRVRVVRPDDRWLDVNPDSAPLSGAGPFDLSFTVERREGAEFSSVPAPQGFLVVAEVGGRTYHHLVATALPGSRFGQPKLFLSESDKGSADTLVSELYLRPNVRQEIFVFVQNPGDKPRKIAVELKVDGNKADGMRSETVEVPPKMTKRVPIGPKEPANDKEELPALTSDIQLRLLDMDNKGNELDRKSVAVTVGQPRHYVRVSQPPSYDPSSHRLTVKLKATQPIVGPKCHVKLVLPKDRIPGLRDLDQGAREGDLPANGEELTLTAENLSFGSRDDPNGYVYLNVDDYERAFVFVTTFADQGTPPAGEEIRNFDLRLRVPHVLRKGDPLQVVVELDKPPAGATVELGIDKTMTGEYTQVKKLAGPRSERVGFKVGGPNSALLFQTSVRDWVYNPDTRGVGGDRPFPIRVRMFKKDGEKIYEKTVPVYFDDTPPANVRFLSVGGASAANADENTPLKVKRTRKLLLRAAGTDPESGVKNVLFFWGKPKRNKDGAILPPTEEDSARGQQDEEDKTWSAALDLASEKKGGDVTVQFTNGVGLTTFKTIPLEIEEPATPSPEKKGGTISGQVLFNNLRQPGTTVTLVDMANKPIRTTTTDDAGRFMFTGVAPGSYTVRSVKKEDAQTKGEVKGVDVELGMVKEVKIELAR